LQDFAGYDSDFLELLFVSKMCMTAVRESLPLDHLYLTVTRARHSVAFAVNRKDALPSLRQA
jgi:hypothetical protein